VCVFFVYGRTVCHLNYSDILVKLKPFVFVNFFLNWTDSCFLVNLFQLLEKIDFLITSKLKHSFIPTL